MKATAIDISGTFSAMPALPKMVAMVAADDANSFALLSEFGSGGVFAASFSGHTPWERHPGDELVVVQEGAADLILLVDDEELRLTLAAGQLVVVPEGTWHRFETEGVRVIGVTPQPTETSLEKRPPKDTT
ncbi:MAG: cupin domain-containing protein [Pseudomonadota bacterium]